MSKWIVTIQKTNTQCKMISVSGPETAESAVVVALNAMKWTTDDCISVTAEVADENAPDAPATINMAVPEPQPRIDDMEDSVPDHPKPKPKPKPRPRRTRTT